MPQTICLEENAFFELIERVVERLEQKNNTDSRWVDGDSAMRILGVKSPTTMQKLRNNLDIRFSQPTRKIILYDRQSLLDYLDKNASDN